MQRQKSRHSSNRAVSFPDQENASMLPSIGSAGPGAGSKDMDTMGLAPASKASTPLAPITPRSKSLDKVTIASAESHEEAIKRTLELMNGGGAKSTPKLQSPVENRDQDSFAMPHVAASRKVSSSFLPSLSGSSQSAPYYADDFESESSGRSSPTMSVQQQQQRRRTTPQLPPPPSRQRPGPEFSRTVLECTVPEMSESQTSLVMSSESAAVRTPAGNATAKGAQHASPRQHKPKKQPAPSTTSPGLALTDSSHLDVQSRSPVAVISPLQKANQAVGARSNQPALVESLQPVSPSEMSLSMAHSRPFSIMSSSLSQVSNTDALQKVLHDMSDLLETVLNNEKLLLDMPGSRISVREHNALHDITEALVAVHDQFTVRMKQMLEGGIDAGFIDPDLQADISQLLLGYLNLTARTVRAQCSAMKDRIAKETNARQGQLDEVKEDFLAEKIKWTAEMGKTRENLQAQKDLLEKQQEMLQSVGTSLQLERHHLEDVITELPLEVQQQVKERVTMHQHHLGSMTTLGSSSSHELLADGERPFLNRSVASLATESQVGIGTSRRSCVPGRTEMFALRELQEEKMRLEKLLCRHQMELKTLKEQHDWAKSGMAVMNETKRVAEHQVDLERKQALRTQSDLQVKLTASEANAHRFEEMYSLEKRKQEELSAHLVRASTELEEARGELKVKAQMAQELQLLRQQLTEQATVQQRLRTQLGNSQRGAREMQERLNQSAARWVRSKKDEERERIEKKWQKITRDAVQLKRASAFQTNGAAGKRR